jgi:hypothetical protein
MANCIAGEGDVLDVPDAGPEGPGGAPGTVAGGEDGAGGVLPVEAVCVIAGPGLAAGGTDEAAVAPSDICGAAVLPAASAPECVDGVAEAAVAGGGAGTGFGATGCDARCVAAGVLPPLTRMPAANNAPPPIAMAANTSRAGIAILALRATGSAKGLPQCGHTKGRSTGTCKTWPALATVQ